MFTSRRASSPPDATASLAEVDIRDSLRSRPHRSQDYELEDRALVALANELAVNPSNMLQKLVETALVLCGAGTAGISVLETREGAEVFRWEALAGAFVTSRNSTMPRDASPAGVCMNENATQLMYLVDRCFPALRFDPRFVETLLVPFPCGGRTIGVVWLVTHEFDRKFNREDERLIRKLAAFGSAGWQLSSANAVLEQRVAERSAALLESNATLQGEIDERKRAEKELRRSEGYLAEGQRLSHTGSWAWNVSSREMYWSPEHFRICGLDPKTAKAFYPEVLQVIHPEDRSLAQQSFEEAIRQKSDFECDCRIVRPDGAIRYIHSVAHPAFNASGNFTGFVGTIIDTTERRKVEEKLAESERSFRLLLESIPHHVWSFRTDGTLVYCNRRLADYTGLTDAELRQGGWAALHRDDVERVQSGWQKAWSQSTPYQVEQRVRGRDGRYRRFVCRAVPVSREAGEHIEWFGTNTDVEDRRQAEDALRQKQAELEHAARVTTMGEFAASIAHEVNQPLGAIVAYGHACLRWLSAEQPDLDEVRSVVTRIVDQGNRAAAILTGIGSLIERQPPQMSTLNMNRTDHRRTDPCTPPDSQTQDFITDRTCIRSLCCNRRSRPIATGNPESHFERDRSDLHEQCKVEGIIGRIASDRGKCCRLGVRFGCGY